MRGISDGVSEEGRGSRDEVWWRRGEGARGEGGRMRERVREKGRGRRDEVWGRSGEGAWGEGKG